MTPQAGLWLAAALLCGLAFGLLMFHLGVVAATRDYEDRIRRMNRYRGDR